MDTASVVAMTRLRHRLAFLLARLTARLLSTEHCRCVGFVPMWKVEPMNDADRLRAAHNNLRSPRAEVGRA